MKRNKQMTAERVRSPDWEKISARHRISIYKKITNFIREGTQCAILERKPCWKMRSHSHSLTFTIAVKILKGDAVKSIFPLITAVHIWQPSTAVAHAQAFAAVSTKTIELVVLISPVSAQAQYNASEQQKHNRHRQNGEYDQSRNDPSGWRTFLQFVWGACRSIAQTACRTSGPCVVGSGVGVTITMYVFSLSVILWSDWFPVGTGVFFRFSGWISYWVREREQWDKPHEMRLQLEIDLLDFNLNHSQSHE